jgi:putative ABC transport system permease protein
VGAVIAMVTLGNWRDGQRHVEHRLARRNLLILSRARGASAAPMPARSRSRPGDVEAIRRDIGALRAVAPVAQRAEISVVGNQNHSTQVTGTDNTYFETRDWQPVSGRIFTDAEVRSGRAACVIGETIRTTLFGSQNPLGSEVRVRDVPCEVVGVLPPKGQSTFGQDQDDLVVMPLRDGAAAARPATPMWARSGSRPNVPRMCRRSRRTSRS